MSIVREAAVTPEGEIRLLVPELAGKKVQVTLDESEEAKPFRRPEPGIYKVLGWMADDFDDPLPEFEPYM